MSYRRRYYKKKNNTSDLSSIFRVLFYFFAIPLILLYVLIKLIVKLINSKSNKPNKVDNNNQPNNSQYQAKTLVTQYEKYFLDIIEKNFSEDYRVMPQVPLSSIVNKHKEFSKQYQGELYRTIDIGIFDKDTFSPLLMIEINDSTHKQADRYKRDLKVREILEKANIPLLTFYSSMPNKENYVINRVKEFLER